jgi:hypothetical protein
VATLAISNGEGRGMGQMMIDRTSWATMKRYLERQAMEAGRKHLEDSWR